MRLSDVAVAAASFGIAAAGVMKPRSSQDNCLDVEFTGEVVQYSLNIIEYPVIVDVELKEDTTVTIDNTILIEVTNAPTHLHTTVYAATTSTVTKTISTATVTASAQGSQGGVTGADGVETITTLIGTTTEASNPQAAATGTTKILVSVAGGAAVGSGANTVSYTASTKSALSVAGGSGAGSGANTVSNTASTKSALPVAGGSGAGSGTNTYLSSASVKSLAPVAGGSAVGSGVNTGLYTASTSNTAVRTVVTTSSGSKSTATKTYTTTVASASATLASGTWTNWNKFKANGVNIGGWLELEQVFYQSWWDQYAPNATDEWTFCQTLGSRCGPVLEEHYATYITTDDIDKVAAVGVNTLRIPTTYAAWIKVPGSALYHGNQKEYLKTITTYAIEKYNMRVVVGLHSLPGGVNSLDIGEKAGNDGWFFNTTNLDYSYQAVDQVLDFFVETGYSWAFTLAHINEASDNPSAFASPETLTTNGTNWIVKYTEGVLSRIAQVDKRIPLMLQDCFLGEEHWSPYFANGTNIVIDTHVYYFAASGVYSQWANGAICGQASVVGGDGKFPVYIGEWALQTLYSNSYSNRKNLFDTQRYVWSYYVQGGSFWSIKHNSSAAVDGQGTQKDYWSYELLIDAGVITSPVANATYC